VNIDTTSFISTLGKYLLLALITILCLHSGAVFADADAGTSYGLGKVSSNITGGMTNLAKLITAASFVMGFGFAAAAILKFKAHKDNPAQIPIGTPIALLFIAGALIYLPSLYKSVGETIFGNNPSAGVATGIDTPDINKK
jgi:intracellular multiplication protein IcmD